MGIRISGNFDTGSLSVKVGCERVLDIKIKELNQFSGLFQNELNHELNKAFNRAFELGRLDALNDASDMIDALITK